jgi:epoxyqueuosine reductase
LIKNNLYTPYVKATASACGFDYCGITKAVKLEDDARRLEKWLQQGKHGSMQYMERYFDIRINPALLVPGAKSVITLLKNYFPEEQQKEETPKISKYAYGKDYHEVIKQKLNSFLQQLKQNIGQVEGRGFIDACPTEAILPNKVIDGSKCISYFTIELKDLLIPDGMKNKFQNWMFGCDICQDVCPWNRFSKAHNEIEFTPIPEVLNLSTNEWLQLTEESFKKLFKNSPLKRSKFKGIQRNLKFLVSEE